MTVSKTNFSQKTFYLFRHGETEWNRIGRLQGSADIPLNSTGINQAKSLRPFFDELRHKLEKDSDFQLMHSLISSPLQRARETARIAFRLGEDQVFEIKSDARFSETHLGKAEGLTRDELIEKFGEDAWLQWLGLGLESWSARFPDGESKGEVRDRALAGLNERLGSESRTWAIATHGGLLRRMLHHFHPNEQTPINVENGSVFKFVFKDGLWSVDRKPVFAVT